MIVPKSFPVSFLKKEELAKDTYTFLFKKPGDFEFIAGQYNRWTLPITTTDGRGNSRLFTISASPLEDYISFTTKIIQSEFKKALLSLETSQEIQVFGPLGKFVLDEKDKRHKILIAGGIGVTPFHSILPYAGSSNLDTYLTLFASFSTPEEMIFFDEFKKIESEHKTIKVVYTITRPGESGKQWDGETGRISENLLKKYVTDLQNCVYYIVGPPAMIEATKQLVQQMGISLENIRIEQFTGY